MAGSPTHTTLITHGAAYPTFNLNDANIPYSTRSMNSSKGSGYRSLGASSSLTDDAISIHRWAREALTNVLNTWLTQIAGGVFLMGMGSVLFVSGCLTQSLPANLIRETIFSRDFPAPDEGDGFAVKPDTWRRTTTTSNPVFGRRFGSLLLITYP